KRDHRQWPQSPADHECLLVVDFGARVALAVVDTRMDVAEVPREVPVYGGAQVRGAQEAFAIDEYGARKPVAVDVLFEVDVRRLLHTEAEPGSFRREVVEVELSVRVLETVGQCSRDTGDVDGARPGDGDLAGPHDVRRYAEGDQVRDGAGDVDVGACDVEGVWVIAVSVRVHGLRFRLPGVVREDRASHL